jgi:hypothetical protein
MNGYARFRDIRQAPDGKVYAMTESPNRFVQLRLTGLNNTSTNDTKNEQIEKGMIYPNPSMGESTLTFYVSKNQFVSVNILSSNGTLINTLVAKPFSKGNYSLTLNSEKLPQGVYCVEINSGSSKTLLKYIKI